MSPLSDSDKNLQANTTMRRPAPISRNNNNDASFTTASSGSAIGRPSLLKDLRVDINDKLQTPWTIGDTSLRPIPPFYPPLDPRCTAIITDSSPSVVAYRISECLRKRSISVEYDDETITATCMTIDRVHFNINLYRGNRNPPPSDPKTSNVFPDLAHAIIVEVVRSRGSVISFHHHNRAILNAAMGQSSGEDKRKPYMTSPLEYPRLQTSTTASDEKPSKRMARAPQIPHALEHALSLLKKDRFGAQRLGMESLINLTDSICSGKELAVLASMAVLGAPIIVDDSRQGEITAQEEIHSFLMKLVIERVLPGDEKPELAETTFDSSVGENDSELGESGSRKSFLSNTKSVNQSAVNDVHHGGVLRSMALRVLANALSVLSENQSSLLSSILKSSRLSSRDFVQALSEDLLGASRLPAVVAGTRLASAHEAALTTRCISILSVHSPSVQQMVANPKRSTHPTLELLTRNQEVRHDFLAKESMKAFYVASQECRTC